MSLNAELVARDVIEVVKSREKVNLYRIAIDRGYSPKTARNAYAITTTKSYQRIMIPAIKRMETIRDKALLALQNKDMNLEDTRVLKEVVDSFTKNLQLLQGKSTENIGISVTTINYGDVEIPDSAKAALDNAVPNVTLEDTKAIDSNE